MPEKVSLRKYLVSRLRAQEKAVSIARTEMNAWKASHNDLQHQMQADRGLYITRAELAALYKKIESVERLVYIGVGIGIVLQIGFGAIIAFLKH